MTILTFKSVLLTFAIAAISPFNFLCEQGKKNVREISNATELYMVVDSIIPPAYYEDLKAPIKVHFVFKVDSLGEVHSAHIVRSTNLKERHYFSICNEIESNYRVKFLFKEFKNADRIDDYVRCNYLFQKPK